MSQYIATAEILNRCLNVSGNTLNTYISDTEVLNTVYDNEKGLRINIDFSLLQQGNSAMTHLVIDDNGKLYKY